LRTVSRARARDQLSKLHISHEWSREKVERYDLPSRCHAVLFSPIFGRIDPREIVEWILADKLDVRFQLQMHKFIWSPTQRGV
jgi:7-carboxy-7-deazaguanine synthase